MRVGKTGRIRLEWRGSNGGNDRQRWSERQGERWRRRDGNNEGRDKAGGLGNCLGNIMNEPQCV